MPTDARIPAGMNRPIQLFPGDPDGSVLDGAAGLIRAAARELAEAETLVAEARSAVAEARRSLLRKRLTAVPRGGATLPPIDRVGVRAGARAGARTWMALVR